MYPWIEFHPLPCWLSHSSLSLLFSLFSPLLLSPIPVSGSSFFFFLTFFFFFSFLPSCPSFVFPPPPRPFFLFFPVFSLVLLPSRSRPLLLSPPRLVSLTFPLLSGNRGWNLRIRETSKNKKNTLLFQAILCVAVPLALHDYNHRLSFPAILRSIYHCSFQSLSCSSFSKKKKKKIFHFLFDFDLIDRSLSWSIFPYRVVSPLLPTKRIALVIDFSILFTPFQPSHYSIR